MLKLATILDNPGEPAVETRYRDPRELKRLGYTGQVFYETTALSGVTSAAVIGPAELRQWCEQQIDEITAAMDRARDAGLSVFFFYDALTLPTTLVERDAEALTCRNRPETLCPGSQRAWEHSLAGLEAALGRWPMVEGVVLRFGETDARRLPHLMGNEVYSPHCARCARLGRADRVGELLHRFHELVAGRFNKRLIARAWNVRPGGMHDSVELAGRIAQRLPASSVDKRFLLSFKFTHTDFWRYQKWNPASLVFGARPIIYELQCQREFEGKGGVPDWQPPLWRDGHPETDAATQRTGLAQVAGEANLAGLWAWVRGGGWGGPFVSSESWIDANVFAVPRLVDHPTADVKTLARDWVRERLNVHDPDAAGAVVDTLAHSPDVVRDAFYIGPFARSRPDPWHPAADWITDDLLDAHAAWRIVQSVSEDELDVVVQEKARAVQQAAVDRVALHRQVGEANRRVLEPLVNTLQYAESFYETLHDLLAGMVAFRRYRHTRSASQAETARTRVRAAQGHWNQHTQRHAARAGCATAFRESGFWEMTQWILAELE